ncbi:DUF5666 domain-containing protein [Actinomycetospora endophytica]|uniref:DUF5666 domain-containing protein n=1 Tax=Actinomycetospora endophytica TaxID=2291215 RepID=A0ABS8PCG2_9PSEU|nr:DUF5666 domain-containing protein [Actinomycetospora endophytica]MCD2195185.1 DUF5666 domain-containing protein [Actinomycetospora endophytica]
MANRLSARRPGHPAAAVVLALVAAVVLAGCSSSTTPAARAARHAVSGKITAEQGSTWTVLGTDGQTTTVQITAATRFGRLHQQSSAAQFPVGASVRVLGQPQGTTITARRVLPPLATRPTETPTATPGAAPPTTTTTTPPPTTTTPPAPAADPNQVAAGAVSAANAAVGAHPGVTAGVAVMDQTTGNVTTGATGASTFESASVVKLFTIVDLLHRSETGAITLSPQDDDDITRALELSDDNAMDDLWESYGGTDTVTEMASLAHLQDTSAPSDPDEWGETVISPRDVLAVYRYALTQLNPADQKTVMGDLSQASDTGADGFDQAFGLLEPPRPAGAEAKQGWMSDGDLYLHTTGVPAAGSRWIVAVETKQPGSDDWDTARSAVNDITGALTGGLARAST